MGSALVWRESPEVQAASLEDVAEVLELVDDIEDVSDEILCEVTVLTAQMDECIETE